ncbi:MAG: DUF2071 domain-containing protein [Polyangiales bacterium]
MIPRRRQLDAIASVAASAAATLTLAVVAASPSLRGSPGALHVGLAATVLASLSTLPLRVERADRVDLWTRGLFYLFFSVARVGGLAAAVQRPTLAEANLQLVFGVILHAALLASASLSAGAFLVALLGVGAFAGVGAALERVAPEAAPAVAWAVITAVRWAQCERFLERALPRSDHGRLAPWRHPGPRGLVWPLELAANSRVLQLLLEPLPVPVLRSDIAEVIYVNYLVEAERLARFVPEGLALQRLGPGGRYALFTFLTYRHGHLGAARMGPLRRLAPSPVQTNWRVHVEDPRTGRRGVRFITNAIDHTALALAARLLAEATPMHALRRAELTRDGDGARRLSLDPGRGSAPDASATLRPAGGPAGVYREPAWEEPWQSCFADFRALLEYCVPQDRAMDAQPWRARVSRQEIRLGIPLDACIRLEGEVRSEAARRVVGDARPLCVLAPGVEFVLRHEAYDPLPELSGPRPSS